MQQRIPFTLLFTFHYIFPTLSRRGNLKKKRKKLCTAVSDCTMKWKRHLKEWNMRLIRWFEQVPLFRENRLPFSTTTTLRLFLNAIKKLSIDGFKGRALFKNAPSFFSKHRIFFSSFFSFFLEPHFSILRSLRENERHGDHDGQLSKRFQVKASKNNFLKNVSKPLNADECSLQYSRHLKMIAVFLHVLRLTLLLPKAMKTERLFA